MELKAPFGSKNFWYASYISNIIVIDALVAVIILSINVHIVCCALAENVFGLGWLLLFSPKVKLMSLCRRATDKEMLCIFIEVKRMDNEALKQVFQKLHPKIIKNVNPDSVINELLAKDIISDGDFCDLSSISDPKSRCRKLFSLLYRSTHPHTFVHFREALLDESPDIVGEIDEQRSSLTTRQLQQPVMSQTTEGKIPRVHWTMHTSMPVFSLKRKPV